MNIQKLQSDTEKRQGIYYEFDAESKPLGEGGMGRVFKGYRVVEQTGARTPVAIKAMYENIPEKLIERARREASIQLDNENLIRMYGFVETATPNETNSTVKPHYHVIMELLTGVTLDELMQGIVADKQGLEIPFARELYTQYMHNRDQAVIRIIKCILSGIMALHDKGFIHRDIDPTNVMITIDGKIKLIDFGICKQTVNLASQDKMLTVSGAFMGKVHYAAPELVIGDVTHQNETTDIYAIGILLFLLYTGHLPFFGSNDEILQANLLKKLPLRDITRSDLRRIVGKATQKSQDKRYASAAEFRVDLEHLPPIARATALSPALLKWVGTGLGAACLIGCIAWLLHTAPETKQPETVSEAPTTDELYHSAYALAQSPIRDSAARGKEQIRILAEDSLYPQAMLTYSADLMGSMTKENMEKGEKLIATLADKHQLPDAMFEYGLTLSKANKYFSTPADRQALLGKDADLAEANRWLEKALAKDSTHYKAAYWLFNNLMEEKINGTLPPEDDDKLVCTFLLFQRQAKQADEAESRPYREAIAPDEATLKAWGLLPEGMAY